MAVKDCDIDKLVANWREAALAKDEKKLRKILHPEFRLVGVRLRGAIAADVDDWLATLNRMDITNLEMKVMDHVQIDKLLVLTIDGHWKVRFMKQEIEERILFTDTWIKMGKDWRLLRRHSSSVPEGMVLQS